MLPIMFGLVASICLIVSSLTLSRKLILILGLGINVFNGIQYMLLGQTGALALTAVGFVMVGTVLASLKYPALGTTKVLAMFLLAYPVVFFSTAGPIASVFGYLPLFSMIIGTIALFVKNVMGLKAIFIVNGLSWLTFELSVGAYGAVPGEIITIMGNCTSFILLAIASKAGIPFSQVPELPVRLARLAARNKGRDIRNPVSIEESPVYAG